MLPDRVSIQWIKSSHKNRVITLWCAHVTSLITFVSAAMRYSNKILLIF